MTIPLARPIQENRVLRETADLRVGLGAALGEIWRAPAWTGLERRAAEVRRAQIDAVTPDQIEAGDRFIEDVTALGRRFAAAETEDERKSLFEQLQAIKDARAEEIRRGIERNVDRGILARPEDLEEEFGGYGLKFERPMSRKEARVLFETKKAEVIRNAIVSRSPAGIFPSLAKFGVGMASMATDPLEVASVFIPVVGPARRAALIGKFGAVGGRAAIGATEGLVGSALTEPAYYVLSRQLQLDYDMADALLNVGLGAALGGGFGAVIGAAARSRPAEGVAAPARRQAAREAVERQAEAAAEVKRPAPTLLPAEKARRAVEQFINDQAVNIRTKLGRAPKRPVSLVEYIRAEIGGINDNDPAFRGELASIGFRKGTRGKTLLRDDGVDLDAAAERLWEAGYLASRDTNELLEKLRLEERGELQFSSRDAPEAETWLEYRKAAQGREQAEDTLDMLRSDLEELGVSDLSDGELALVLDEYRRNGFDADSAVERVAIRLEDMEAEIMARYAGDVTSDPVADVAASEAAERILRGDAAPELRRADRADVALDEDTANLREMVGQIDRDQLSPEARAELDEIAEIERRAKEYARVSAIAAACVAR